MDALVPTDRTRLRRKADRGHFDWPTVAAILDEGFVCHLAFSVDGVAYAMPTAYGRVGRYLFVHGAAANHALGALRDGASVCAAVTLVDGLVLARSAFHHSMNYRSVMIFGTATEVEDADEKERALLAIVDHVVPGRSAEARPPAASELRATRVLRIPIVEASAKVRTGEPIDDPEDLSLSIWAGEIPLRTAVGTPLAAGGVPADVGLPPSVTGYRRH